jgi:hypothetical protein
VDNRFEELDYRFEEMEAASLKEKLEPYLRDGWDVVSMAVSQYSTVASPPARSGNTTLRAQSYTLILRRKRP